MTEHSLDQPMDNSSSADHTCTNKMVRSVVSPTNAAIAVAVLTFGLMGGYSAAQWWAHGSIASSELPLCHNDRSIGCIPNSDFVNFDEVTSTTIDISSSTEPQQSQSRTLEADTKGPGHLPKNSPSDPTSQPTLLHESINKDYISMLSIDEMLQEEIRLEAILKQQTKEMERRRKVKSNLRSKNSHYANEIRMMEMKLEKLAGESR